MMHIDHLTRLMHMNEESLPDLDEVVLGALMFLEALDLPRLDIRQHTRPLVVGSGNALATGRILFEDADARVVNEGDFEHVLRLGHHDSVYIISASGAKHAVTLAEAAVASGLPTYLITSAEDSPGERVVGKASTYVFPHIREPYTYNTSTYLGMLYGATTVSPRRVRTYIETVVDPLITDLSRFNAFLMIVPPEFGEVCGMYETKFDELFGPHVLGRACTSEGAKHAKTVITAPDQCFITFGELTTYGNPGGKITIPLMDDVTYPEMIAVGYYVIGMIQKTHPPYFKDNIAEYVKEASAIFGHTIPVIVP